MRIMRHQGLNMDTVSQADTLIGIPFLYDVGNRQRSCPPLHLALYRTLWMAWLLPNAYADAVCMSTPDPLSKLYQCTLVRWPSLSMGLEYILLVVEAVLTYACTYGIT